MKRKYRLKKKPLIVLILIILVLILLFTIFISHLKNKSYSLEYNLEDYKISENYDSKKELYYYEITYKDIKYDFIYKSKYLKEKQLINKITNNESNNMLCLYIESDYITSNPLCSDEDNNVIYYKINEDEIVSEEKELNNYTIYNDINNVYLWNYKGLLYLKDNDFKEINLFKKDIYDIPLATKINEYLVIPDYEQNYSFNKVYVINLKDNKKDTWKLKYDISFESIVLGINKESIFILDKKNNIEYELVPHKQKMRIVGTNNKQGMIYEYGELKRMSLSKINSSNYQFKYSKKYNYKLEDNKLYLKYLDNKNKMLVSNKEITSIVYMNEDTIYYLIKDTLYKFNLKDGETKLIKYADWEFNNNNLIFIN